MGEMVSFKCPDGRSVEGYHAACESSGAIVLLQEWWGLNEQMKGVAERCRAAGFSALVPDLYHGRVTQDPDEAGHLMEGLDWVGATEQEVKGAAEWLHRSADKVAVMGYCMGGALSVIAGVKLENISAVVPYYGIPPAEQADPARLRVPLQGHFANVDDWCTPEAVNDLEKALEKSGQGYEIYRYDAKHAFFNEAEPEVYDEAVAEQSWQRSLKFLRQHLLR